MSEPICQECQHTADSLCHRRLPGTFHADTYHQFVPDVGTGALP